MAKHAKLPKAVNVRYYVNAVDEDANDVSCEATDYAEARRIIANVVGWGGLATMDTIVEYDDGSSMVNCGKVYGDTHVITDDVGG